MKTSQLTGRALDYAAALASGRVVTIPPTATNETMPPVPCTLWEIAYMLKTATMERTWLVRPIYILRHGILPNCSGVTVSFRDADSRAAQGSADMFYLTQEAAQQAADLENRGGLEGFEPTQDDAQCWPLVFGERVGVHADLHSTDWFGVYVRDGVGSSPVMINMRGKDPREAALKAYVHKKLGTEVDIPENL